MNFLHFAIEQTYAIEHAIYSIGRLHVKNSGDVVSFDDVLPNLDIFNCRENHFQNPTTTSRPASGGTRGLSKVISVAKGTLEISLLTSPFRYASTSATFSSRVNCAPRVSIGPVNGALTFG